MIMESPTADLMNTVESGEGEPVVFVHGVGSHLESWDGVVKALGAGYRSLRYDLRGHGSSPKPPGPYQMGDFVGDLESLLVARHWPQRFHLVGFSLGGLIAQAHAIAQPDSVATLTIVSSIAGRTPTERAKVEERAAQLATGGAPVHLQTAVERWFSDEFRERHPEIVRQRMVRSLENDPVCYAAAYQVLASVDLAADLHRIQCPCLVMTGAEDQGSTPRMARLMADRIRDSRLHILEGLRHSVLLEAPERVGRLVSDFLASHRITNAPV
jgi:(E)-2-((N-methylformamido)methylene)succinate hydrolase